MLLFFYLFFLLLCNPQKYILYKGSSIFLNFITVTLVHSVPVNLSGNLALLIGVAELL